MHIKKRHYFANNGLSSQSYGFSTPLSLRVCFEVKLASNLFMQLMGTFFVPTLLPLSDKWAGVWEVRGQGPEEDEAVAPS